MKAAGEAASFSPLYLVRPLYHLICALLGWQQATTAPWLGHTSLPEVTIGSSNHPLRPALPLWGSGAADPPESEPGGCQLCLLSPLGQQPCLNGFIDYGAEAHLHFTSDPVKTSSSSLFFSL